MKKLILLIPLILTGCVMVPASKIQIGPISLNLPKNYELVGPELVVNGPSNFTFKAQLIKSSNDPAVIDKTAAGQVAIMRELGSQVRQGAAAIATEMVK
jgi:hypothetical protein